MTALANVQLRDGRFVMLPTDRISATRSATSGLLRQRGLWFVACLHLLSDAQRHELGGSAATISREALCAMTNLSPKTLTKLTRMLIAESVLEVQRPIGPSGSLPSVYRLLGAADGPRVIITHPALRVMRAQIPAGRLTGAFATYLTIAELLNEQRSDSATASRQQIAGRVGVSSTRSIDEYVDALQTAQLIRKHARNNDRGQQPAIWELTEPAGDFDTQTFAQNPRAASESGRPSAAGTLVDSAQNGTVPLATEEQASCSTGTTLAQSGHGPKAEGEHPPRNQSPGGGAKCSTPQVSTAPPTTHASDDGQYVQNQDILNPPVAEQQRSASNGGGAACDVDRLCEHLAASLASRATPAILQRPGGWHVAADAWRRAAAEVLKHVDLKRALSAIECVEGDAYLARHIRSMPAFAERLDEVLLHVSAVNARSGSRAAPGGGDGAPAWAEAQQHIGAAIRRHGTKRAAAVAELAAEHPAYEPFIGLVGWTNLCREDPQRRQWDWQQAWKQAVGAVSDTTAEEATA